MSRAARTAALAAALVVGFAGCQRSGPSEPPILPAITDPLETPVVFTAQKAGHTLTLFGTIHLGADPSAIPAWVLARLDQAPAVAVEPNLSEPLTLMATRRGDAHTLESDLGRDGWSLFETAVGPRTAIELRPLPISAAARVLEFRGFTMTKTMAPFLFERAQQAKKTIVALEEPGVAAALDAQWIDLRLVRAMLDQPMVPRTSTAKLIHGYALGIDDELVAASEDDKLWTAAGRSDFAAYRKAVLIDRNAAWVPRLDAMAAAGDGFVAVDVRRLLGPDSLPELLGKAGFTIARATAP